MRRESQAEVENRLIIDAEICIGIKNGDFPYSLFLFFLRLTTRDCVSGK